MGWKSSFDYWLLISTGGLEIRRKYRALWYGRGPKGVSHPIDNKDLSKIRLNT